jgi:hypothetical protein
MKLDISKAIPLCISLIAIAISIATIIMTRRNLKKQLRLAKLEEIVETLNFFYGYYIALFWLYHDTKNAIKDNLNSDNPKVLDLLKRKDIFFNDVNRENTVNKISRLRVLSNSYLDNSKNLKSRIFAVADVYYKMYMFSQTSGSFSRFDEESVIPKPGEMKRFLLKIEDDLILEMNLGYKGLNRTAHENYLKSEFRKELEK